MDLLSDIRKLKQQRNRRKQLIQTQILQKIPQPTKKKNSANVAEKAETIEKEKQISNSQINKTNLKIRVQQQKIQDTQRKNEEAKLNSDSDDNYIISSKQKSSLSQNSQKLTDTVPTDLFQGLKFSFPVYNVGLSEKQSIGIKSTIKKLGGEVIQFDDLIDSCLNDQQTPFVDFLLVDSNTLRQTVEQLAKDNISYQQILDFNYVFKCKKMGKILKLKKFIIPYKSQQLESYIRKKQIEAKIEKQQESKYHRKQYKYEPGTGIQEKVQNQNGKYRSLQLKCRSYNKQLSDAFQRLKQLHEVKDKGRAYVYGKVAMILIRPSTPRIYRQEDVDKLTNIRFIGYKTINKIKQFVRTGSIQLADILAGKEIHLARLKLQKIYGIGNARAQNIYNQGIKTIQELRSAVQAGKITLTKNQLIGLKFYQQLNQRIPYQKAKRIFQFVKLKLFEIVGSDKLHNIQACGSFRRKKQTCGDVDIIISRIDGYFEKDLLSKLINKLTQCQFLTDHLTTLKKPQSTDNSVSFMGICKFQSESHHRIDIKYYPLQQYPFALLYFTGSQNFNINLRNYALRKSYTLTDHGMWPVQRVGRQLMARGAVISFKTQRDIFEFLGLKYKTPEERSV